jgi:hypothetical protein
LATSTPMHNGADSISCSPDGCGRARLVLADAGSAALPTVRAFTTRGRAVPRLTHGFICTLGRTGCHTPEFTTSGSTFVRYKAALGTLLGGTRHTVCFAHRQGHTESWTDRPGRV